jgi:hypothetical protein
MPRFRHCEAPKGLWQSVFPFHTTKTRPSEAVTFWNGRFAGILQVLPLCGDTCHSAE